MKGEFRVAGQELSMRLLFISMYTHVVVVVFSVVHNVITSDH